jgi:hypothetical protein
MRILSRFKNSFEIQHFQIYALYQIL